MQQLLQARVSIKSRISHKSILKPLKNGHKKEIKAGERSMNIYVLVGLPVWTKVVDPILKESITTSNG